jgi:hypothetical protein
MRSTIICTVAVSLGVVLGHPVPKGFAVEPSSFPATQTKRGGRQRAAAGPTRDEFKAVVKACLQEWEKLEVPDENGERATPIWSWDNARIHGDVTDGESWAELGITGRDHTRLPPYSPDMHSVIELSHAHLMASMQDYINERQAAPQDDLSVYTCKLQELFKTRITPQWAQETTHRLFLEVLPAVLAAGGCYPPKQKR